MQGQYNMRNPAVKRLMKEAQELREPTEQYFAQPLEDNLFEWHFTIRGPVDSEFEDGVYHGRIILPPEYPMKPPSIILLTSNGRFEVFKKICLSISGHHPESWQPSWSIRTALLAIIGFMPTHGNGAIGSLDYTAEERKVLARRSQEFKCPDCGIIKDKLKAVTEASEAERQEAKELASQINFQAENKANGKDKGEKKEKESEPEKKDEVDASETTATSGSDSTPSSTTPESAAAQAAMGFPGFPGYPGGMPFSPSGGFAMPPPFMFPPGMTPPTSTANGNGATPNPLNPFGMPPGMMMPPFWPPMMPPASTTSATQVPPGAFPPFPPFMASPAAMMAQQQVMRSFQSRNSGSSNAPKSQSATTTVSSASASYQSSSRVRSSSQSSESPATSTSATTTTNGASSGATATTAASSTTSSATSTPTTSTTTPRSTSAPEVRRRYVAQAPGAHAPPPPAAQGPFAGAAVPSDQNIRQSENPLVILLMVLLGIAILALLVRRVYMMNTWRFDTDF